MHYYPRGCDRAERRAHGWFHIGLRRLWFEALKKMLTVYFNVLSQWFSNFLMLRIIKTTCFLN